MAEPAVRGAAAPGATAGPPGARYPLLLDLTGRAVLVVGGGPVAARRAAGLLEAGAEVHVIAPDLCEDLADLLAAGRVTWSRREAQASDVDRTEGRWWLVHTATGDRHTDAAIAERAEAAGIWCVRADRAEASAAHTPAVAHGPDGVQVAVSGGGDPGRARDVRDAIADLLATGRLPLRRTRAPRAGASGRVVLVGGGPGDPGLLTVTGRQWLARADVVVTDRLGPTDVLAELGADVEIIDVGKTAGNHPIPQDAINRILVERAQAGRTVVRLKGGDPFVLGRGGEEALHCLAHGVPVEVVPGVTSAISVPAAAGIPVTHRGHHDLRGDRQRPCRRRPGAGRRPQRTTRRDSRAPDGPVRAAGDRGRPRGGRPGPDDARRSHQRRLDRPPAHGDRNPGQHRAGGRGRGPARTRGHRGRGRRRAARRARGSLRRADRANPAGWVSIGQMSLTLLAHGSPDPRHARDVASLAGRLRVAGHAAGVAYLDHHAPSPEEAARSLLRSGATDDDRRRAPGQPGPPCALRRARGHRDDALGRARVLGSRPLSRSACIPCCWRRPRSWWRAPSCPSTRAPESSWSLPAPGTCAPWASMEALFRSRGGALAEALGARSVRAAYLDGGRPLGRIRTLMRCVDGCTSFVVVPMVIADGIMRDRIVTAAERHDMPVTPGVLADTSALADLVVLRAASAPAPSRGTVPLRHDPLTLRRG